MKKKLVMIAMSICMAFGVASCGEKEEVVENVRPEFKKLVDEYEEANMDYIEKYRERRDNYSSEKNIDCSYALDTCTELGEKIKVYIEDDTLTEEEHLYLEEAQKRIDREEYIMLTEE